jgi:hypothetical protein
MTKPLVSKEGRNLLLKAVEPMITKMIDIAMANLDVNNGLSVFNQAYNLVQDLIRFLDSDPRWAATIIMTIRSLTYKGYDMNKSQAFEDLKTEAYLIQQVLHNTMSAGLALSPTR